jgi:hypothetical protein
MRILDNGPVTSPPSSPRCGVAVRLWLAKAVLVGAVAVLGTTGAGEDVRPPLPVPVTAERPVPAAAAARVDRLVRRHRCSSDGLDGAVPSLAVVLVRGGVRLVDFDTGWAVHTGRRAGTLLAVCP